jgi:hypothetical protein
MEILCSLSGLFIKRATLEGMVDEMPPFYHPQNQLDRPFAKIGRTRSGPIKIETQVVSNYFSITLHRDDLQVGEHRESTFRK